MSYPITAIAGVNLSQVGNGDGTTAGKLIPMYAAGTTVVCNDGVYIYLAAGATIAQYELVKISNTYTATAATTTTLPSTEPAACAVQNLISAGLTSGQYAWFFKGPGLVTVLCAASCVQDVKLYTTGTQGVVDDSSTTLVNGLKLIATITTAAASPCVAETALSTVAA